MLVLAGCAVDPPRDEPDPAPTSTIETVARPASVWDVSCDELVPTATVDAMVGPEAVPQPYRLIAANVLGAAAIRQAGGITCAWAEDGSPEAEATITVLPDSAAGFAQFSATATSAPAPFTPADLFDGLLVRCRDGAYDSRGNQCEWVALSDGVSVTASFLHLGPEALQNPNPAPNPDTSLPAAIPAIEGSAGLAVLEGVFAALAQAPAVELETLAAVGDATCASLTPADLASVLGAVEADFGILEGAGGQVGFPYTGFFQETVARALIGASSCSFGTTGNLEITVTASVAPGLGWVLAYPDQANGPQSTPVGDLGTGELRCFNGEDGHGCTAAVESDGVLYVIETFGSGAQPLTEAQAVALLSALID